MPDFLEEVLAVDHDADPGVVRRGVELAVVRPGLDQAGQEVVTAELRRPVGEVDERAGRLERLDLGVPELDEVGGVAARQRGRLALDDPGPLLALEHDLDVGMDLVELGHRVLDHRVGVSASPFSQSRIVPPSPVPVPMLRPAAGWSVAAAPWSRAAGASVPAGAAVVAGASVPAGRVGAAGASVPLGASVAAVSSSSSPHAATSSPAVASKASNRTGRVLFTLFSPLFLSFCPWHLRLRPIRQTVRR